MAKRNIIKAAIVAIALAFAVPLAAQDFNAGVEAYQRGDYAAALGEFRALAEQGHATAQTNLGIMYHDGLGVAQDYAEALSWYNKAAALGNVFAYYNLGLMYSKGDGVAQDVVLAHMWWTLAAGQGDEAATKDRDIVAGKMTPAQIAEAQKLAREWQPK